MGEEGGGKPPSYRNVAANDKSGVRARRPTFEPPAQIRDQLLAKEQGLRTEMDTEAGTSQPKQPRSWEPGKCIPQLEKSPRYLISSTRVGEHTQFMKEHALIGKFLGLWPTERDLNKWIKHWWNPKGDYEVQLSSKGFFTIILYNLEDKDRIFENGPYFFNSAGLFLRFWTERFSPDKEDFTMAPVWIRLYSLPQEFWLEEILMGIGNTLGQYVKASEATKQRKYTSYARICVYMNISKALPGSVTLEYQDEDWQQTLDYEHIPFRCRRCHEHGHLFRDCPLIKQAAKASETRRRMASPPSPQGGGTPQERKSQIPVKKLQPKTHMRSWTNCQKKRKSKTHIRTLHRSPTNSPNINPNSATGETHTEDRGEGDGDTPMLIDDRDLAGIDLEKLEEALNQKDLHTLPEEQLRKVHKVFLNSSAGSTARLGIATDLSSGSKRIPRENKRRGRKTAHQLIKEAGNLMINSGQIHKLSEGYLHSAPPS
jgi:hypothetical protein